MSRAVCVNVAQVGAVKNQGQCGSCWAFSGISAIESAYMITTGAAPAATVLSEEQIVACLNSGTKKWGSNGCGTFGPPSTVNRTRM